MLVMLLMTAALLQGTVSSAVGQPAAALSGRWNVDVVDGIKVIPNTRVTMAFDNGRVSGHASCNSYSGTYRLTAESRLAIEHVLATMMACDGPVMSQERDMLALLRAVERFEARSDGTLVLTTAAGKTLEARRPPASQ